MSALALTLALAVIRETGSDGAPADRWFHRLGRTALQAGLAGRPEALPPGTRRVEVGLLLADDATLWRLNRQYRGVDRATDVLAFAQLEGQDISPPGGRSLHLGDVAISLERARRQAGEYSHPFHRELGYLFVHGLLHLLGYDHESDAERDAMRRAEEAALGAYGLPRVPPPATPVGTLVAR